MLLLGELVSVRGKTSSRVSDPSAVLRDVQVVGSVLLNLVSPDELETLQGSNMD